MGDVVNLEEYKARRAICALCIVANVAFVAALAVGLLYIIGKVFR